MAWATSPSDLVPAHWRSSPLAASVAHPRASPSHTSSPPTPGHCSHSSPSFLAFPVSFSSFFSLILPCFDKKDVGKRQAPPEHPLQSLEERSEEDSEGKECNFYLHSPGWIDEIG